MNLCVSIELYTETIYDGAFIQSPVLTNVIPSLASRNQSPLLLGANFLKTPLKNWNPPSEIQNFVHFDRAQETREQALTGIKTRDVGFPFSVTGKAVPRVGNFADAGLVGAAVRRHAEI